MAKKEETKPAEDVGKKEIEAKAQEAEKTGVPVIIRDVTAEFDRLKTETLSGFITRQEAQEALAHLSKRIDEVVAFLNEQFKLAQSEPEQPRPPEQPKKQ